ncbi:hypothetical protein ACFE04_001755 [Oxalis oulophora]
MRIGADGSLGVFRFSCNALKMSVETQPPLDAGPRIHPEHISVQDGDLRITLSAPNVIPQQLTVKEKKKPTRRWAAWTRQEEESFFAALRQNFEKITRRVQSKNKDQVRHYYYRLVRRMNKLLDPELFLDAKNSKDTNAAMLRWWSLLDKYSCKASKLHLKPRRFKIFLDALEHQLMKDRKKNVRKRPSQGENSSPTAESSISSPNKASGHDSHSVKLVLVDSQNIQKLGSGKGSLKRNNSIGVHRTNTKGDSTTMKASRQRRKPGVLSSAAAYKKWEKAAIAGVSLVADAAEHLERTAVDKEVENCQGQEVIDPPVEKVLPPLPPLPPFSHSLVGENNHVHNSTKLKLQLFPIDDGTRRALEMDKHNPHLELTLSCRKKISSVLEHLHRKWGQSSIASGELVLFPYNIQRENLVGHHRWTQDSGVSTADVHAMIGSPPLFRLRYGWFSNLELRSFVSQTHLASCCTSQMHNLSIKTTNANIKDSAPAIMPSTHDQPRTNFYGDKPTSVSGNNKIAFPQNEVSKDIGQHMSENSGNNLEPSPDTATIKHQHRKDSSNEDNLRASNGIALSAGEWADSLTNISVGDLLAEVPHHEMDANNYNEPLIPERSQYVHQLPFSCDSFDAAIAAHISRHHNSKIGASQSTVSSIWDAEETCDAFSFRKNLVSCQEDPGSSDGASPNQITRTSSPDSGGFFEEKPETEELMDQPDNEDVHDCLSDPRNMENTARDSNFTALTDVYWPDSLGPLDLDVPTSKYHSEDMILGNSLGGLSNLIASSLDAFQNCSFFGLEKREKSSTPVEAQETSTTDFRNGSF